jgi:hypothetical protein
MGEFHVADFFENKIKHMKNRSLLSQLGMLAVLIVVTLFTQCLTAQPLYDYSKSFLAASQLGYRVHSAKQVMLVPGTGKEKLPEAIPFYIVKVGERVKRETQAPDVWKGTIFQWPFEIQNGNFLPSDTAKRRYVYKGLLKKTTSRWGTYWIADFSDFTREGFFQIETYNGSTVPFLVSEQLYDRLDRGYLEFMYCQRSGMEIPGIRPEENSDDGRLMSNPSYYMPVAGGWNDAGDWRKWLFLTLGNLEALMDIYNEGHPAFRQSALDEISWGNAYFHNMINDSGYVFEDCGGGFNRAKGMDEGWWNENHPGVNAGGDMDADNIPMNGNERSVRDQHNPLVQYKFVRYQALCSSVVPAPNKSNCRVLAERAWTYGQKHPHDGRTLFVAEELLAAMELLNAGSVNVDLAKTGKLIETLIERQEIHPTGLSGYFMEKDKKDGFRCIAFPAEPGFALLRVLEVNHPGLAPYKSKIEKALLAYIDDYIIRDSKSNPFGIPPYGVYVNPPFPDLQLFRDAGNDRFVRTFMHVLSKRPIPHGVNANFLVQANFVSRAALYFKKADWIRFSEGVLQWSTGYNTAGMCLFTGVGFKHPLPASFLNYKIPSGVCVGFMGRLNDTPYQETSNTIEWSTQEIWDIPYLNTVELTHHIKAFYAAP